MKFKKKPILDMNNIYYSLFHHTHVDCFMIFNYVIAMIL